jgi:hypothetical protein
MVNVVPARFSVMTVSALFTETALPELEQGGQVGSTVRHHFHVIVPSAHGIAPHEAGS